MIKCIDLAIWAIQGYPRDLSHVEARVPQARVPQVRVPQARVPQYRVPQARVPQAGGLRRTDPFKGTLKFLAFGASHRLTLMQISKSDPWVLITGLLSQDLYCTAEFWPDPP